jgi:hypothetical protein
MNVPEAHAATILLGDTFRATGRTLEAWVLIRGIDDDVGTEVLDAELRMEYLRVAAAVAKARADGGDREAAEAARTYAAALQEVQAR